MTTYSIQNFRTGADEGRRETAVEAIQRAVHLSATTRHVYAVYDDADEAAPPITFAFEGGVYKRVEENTTD